MDSIRSEVSLKDRVIADIYFERQEPDSSLCAQHCLNALLQDAMYTAADLADVAKQLDQREADARGEATTSYATATRAANPSGSSRRRQASPTPIDRFGQPSYLNADQSRNMDDSGFFSVQVMDEALQNFGLQLVRWRSEHMRSLHDAPEQQEAFVFNLSQHWFVIRRFGHSKHFWFDLNSFHPRPKHVSPLYLGLQIDQAENEGYSVFAVMMRKNETIDSPTLPQCLADAAVFALAQEGRVLNGFHTSAAGDDRRGTAVVDDESVFTSTGSGPQFSRSGFGNEDEELNRAIEASLQSNTASTSGSGYSPANYGAQFASTGAQSTSSSIPDFDMTEDPELAAAIAASLETSKHEPPQSDANLSEDVNVWAEEGEDEDISYDEEATKGPAGPRGTTVESAEPAHDVEEEVLTADEIRRRRLARFA